VVQQRMPTSRFKNIPTAELPLVEVVSGVELERLRIRLEDNGVCRQSAADPDEWHPANGGRTPRALFWAQVEARTACAGCPVALGCVQAVVSLELQPNRRAALSGIWGGLAEWEWRQIVRRAQAQRAAAKRSAVAA
jgi:hypothetical protein